MALDDKVWQALRRRLEASAKSHVVVGVLANKGGTADHGGVTMVELAAIHEFGAPKAGIPERSFLRSTMSKQEPALNKLIGRLAHEIVEKGMEVHQALELLGTWGAAAVKKAITTGPGIPPELKPETVARKGSTRPLVNTGRLLDAITYEVR